LLKISQKVAQKLLQKGQKLLSVTEVAQKLLKKQNLFFCALSSFIWSGAKICKCTIIAEHLVVSPRRGRVKEPYEG